MLPRDDRLKVPYYQVQNLAQESFRLLEIHGAHGGCSWHFHPEFQLSLVLSGSGQRVVGDSMCPIGPGEVTLLGGNLPHVWRYDDVAEPDDPAHAIVIHFREDFAGSEFFRKPEMYDIRLLLARTAQGLQAHGRTREKAVEIVSAMPEHEGFQRVLDLLKVLHLLAGSRETTAICSAGFQPLSANLEIERLGRVCAYIQSHLGEPIHRDEVAAIAHLTPSAFSRFFRAHTGKTFHDFVNEVRVGHACRLLLEATFNITEIAMECGFADVTSFNRSFRRLKKVSPTEYRRRLHAVAHPPTTLAEQAAEAPLAVEAAPRKMRARPSAVAGADAVSRVSPAR